ncbi:hypothetical protein M378DRAFT_979205 [Amanita muscaria Koide BX008]|uniref:Uncharacterized protein n=1 Tax=Amanita muscaria (strain Koide BX008) TaxID=946122 RepID=A0A0C2XEE2_AMAMK|nr:hypothetical protein M378DRAFT_979205 [Amanita muscaria Koide BX008]
MLICQYCDNGSSNYQVKRSRTTYIDSENERGYGCCNLSVLIPTQTNRSLHARGDIKITGEVRCLRIYRLPDSRYYVFGFTHLDDGKATGCRVYVKGLQAHT